jgi:hypothetical protein
VDDRLEIWRLLLLYPIQGTAGERQICCIKYKRFLKSLLYLIQATRRGDQLERVPVSTSGNINTINKV